MVAVAQNLRSIVDHDGGVILDIPHDTLTSLNAIGAYVWRRLEEGQRVDAIVTELARDTGADSTVVARDVDEFLEHLKTRHLIFSPHERNDGSRF